MKVFSDIAEQCRRLFGEGGGNMLRNNSIGCAVMAFVATDAMVEGRPVIGPTVGLAAAIRSVAFAQNISFEMNKPTGGSDDQPA